MTIAENLDREPAAADTTRPEPQAQDDGVNAGDDLDLLELDADADGEGEGKEAADASAHPTEDADRPAWQRPEGLQGDDLVEWKAAQGLPTDATGYEVKLDLAEGQTISETGQQLIDGLKTFAVEHDLPAPAVSKLAQWYDAQVKAQHAKFAENDKALRTETRDELAERWGDQYASRIEVAQEGARVLPKGLRAALKVARLPDGTRLAHMADFAQALFEIGRLRTRKGNTVPTSDEARLAEITKIRDTNIDRYEREGLGKEALDLMRKADAAKSPRTPGVLSAAEQQEERDLTQLMQTDVDTYAHRPWRGLGVTGSARLLQLRRKRDGAAA